MIIAFKTRALLFPFGDIPEKHRETQKRTLQLTFSLLDAEGVFIAMCYEFPSSYSVSQEFENQRLHENLRLVSSILQSKAMSLGGLGTMFSYGANKGDFCKYRT